MRTKKEIHEYRESIRASIERCADILQRYLEEDSAKNLQRRMRAVIIAKTEYEVILRTLDWICLDTASRGLA